jgi:hypothetical protein
MLDLEMGGRLSNFPDVLTVLLQINQLPRFSGSFQLYKFRLTIYAEERFESYQKRLKRRDWRRLLPGMNPI